MQHHWDNVYLSGLRNYRRIRSSDGVVEAVAELMPQGYNIVVASDGTLFHSEGDPGHIYRQRPFGPRETLLTTPWVELIGGTPQRLILGVEAAGSLWELDLKTRNITRLVGNGKQEDSVDGLWGPDTTMNRPEGAVEDASGNVYVADSFGARIRRIDHRTGAVTAVAGDGYNDYTVGWQTGRYSGDGGPATEASLSNPMGLRFGPDGALYIADAGNNVIRRVSVEPMPPSTHVRRIVHLGRGLNAVSIPGDPGETSTVLASWLRQLAGSPFVSRTVVENGAVRFQIHAPDLAPADFPIGPTQACLLVSRVPRTIDLTNRGTLQPGNVVTVAGVGVPGLGSAEAPSDTCPLAYPEGLAFDSRGRLLIVDSGNHRVLRLDLATRRMISVAGTPSRTAGCEGTYFGGPCGAWNPDGLLASQSALNNPLKVAVDARDNLYVYDGGNHRVARIDARTGILTTVLTVQRTITAMTVGPQSDLYFMADDDPWLKRLHMDTGTTENIIGTNDRSGWPTVFSTAVQPLDSTFLSRPTALVFRDDAHLAILDSGVLEVDFSAHFARGRFAIRYGDPLRGANALVLLPDGSYLMLDEFSHRLYGWSEKKQYQVLAGDAYDESYGTGNSGVIGRYAGDGGPAKFASFSRPTAMALSPAGDLYIADTRNHAIRMIKGPMSALFK